MDLMGNYVGWWRRWLPPSEIQKMKKNMKKVPIIQEKSEKYHLTEEEEAERIIKERLANHEMINDKWEMSNVGFWMLNEKRSRWEKAINRIKKIFKS